MTIELHDVFYIVTGLVFAGFTFVPLFGRSPFVTAPIVFLIAGALLALSPLALPLVDPLESVLSRDTIEYLTELIVIIALAGAGLAVDREAGKREWQHTWVLLILVMPLSIVAVAYLGYTMAGLSIACSMLLAAALAPTDPVLARAVQVEGPLKGEEDDVRLSLTTEAGLNDGLAFPFVHLAVVLAGMSLAGVADIDVDKLWTWVWLDLLYRVAMGVAAGWVIGHLVARFVFSRYGDAATGGENQGLVLMASTFLVYGLTEMVGGYGFLAVFVSARATRAFVRGTEHESYATMPHWFSDQIEKVLLALLLLWLGSVAVSGILNSLSLGELGVALLLIVVIRPVIAYICLLPTQGSRFDRGLIAMMGIRGFGTFFYVAYAQSQSNFDDIESIWRICIVAVILSIFVHGMTSAMAERMAAKRA
ncbi:MAG: cation transporter [unclassified Hahellaceae]|nr:cation transporter [Hahellaceae bacterium]|tara:strand:+ start:7576 stop:8838 length:1263 start_codon:yes stop_codon:yes gene_type:complete